MKTVYGVLLTGLFGYCVAVDLPDRASAQTEKLVYSFCHQASCEDGGYPEAGVINDKGTLYGTTLIGGANNGCNNNGRGCGTVFSIDLATGREKVLYSFCGQENCTDGDEPLRHC